MRLFASNFKPLDFVDDEKEDKSHAEPDMVKVSKNIGKKYPKYDPETKNPEIPVEEFKRMEDSIKRFAHAMGLGQYQMAQSILTDHKVDIDQYFLPEHPAHLSVLNNQAMLWKINGKYFEAKHMFEEVYDAYS